MIERTQEERDQIARNLGFPSQEAACKHLGYTFGWNHDKANARTRRLSVRVHAGMAASEMQIPEELKEVFIASYLKGCRTQRKEEKA